MTEGRCVFWNAEEGWGVVVGDAGPGEVWVHFSALSVPGYRELRADERVSFRWETPRGGQDGYAHRATRVIPLDRA